MALAAVPSPPVRLPLLSGMFLRLIVECSALRAVEPPFLPLLLPFVLGEVRGESTVESAVPRYIFHLVLADVVIDSFSFSTLLRRYVPRRWDRLWSSVLATFLNLLEETRTELLPGCIHPGFMDVWTGMYGEVG